jgi:hypothetical protein
MAEQAFVQEPPSCSHDDERWFFQPGIVQDGSRNVTAGIGADNAPHRNGRTGDKSPLQYHVLAHLRCGLAGADDMEQDN